MRSVKRPINVPAAKVVKVRPIIIAVRTALQEIGQAADRDKYRKTLPARAMLTTETRA